MRIASVAVACVLLPAVALSQKPLCGPAAEFEGQLASVGRILSATDSAATAFRLRYGIPTVDSTATREVVTKTRDCNRLLRATGVKLRTIYGSDKGPLDDFEFAFFRVGDYYVALQVTDPDAAIVLQGRAEIVVFRVKDLGVVARAMT